MGWVLISLSSRSWPDSGRAEGPTFRGHACAGSDLTWEPPLGAGRTRLMRTPEFVKSHRRVGNNTQWDWRPELEQPPVDDAQHGFDRRGSEAEQKRNQQALRDTEPTRADRNGREQVRPAVGY